MCKILKTVVETKVIWVCPIFLPGFRVSIPPKAPLITMSNKEVGLRSEWFVAVTEKIEPASGLRYNTVNVDMFS